MKQRTWTVELDGQRHSVELESTFGPRWSVKVDGVLVAEQKPGMFTRDFSILLDIAGHPASVRVQTGFGVVAHDLLVDGRSVSTGKEAARLAPMPPWAWIFIVACGIIPIISLGGAIPAAIGFGGAAGCAGIARNANQPVATRVALCVVVVAVCWVLFGVMIAAFAGAFSGRSQ
jgi:hypothetical protein